MVYIVIAYYLKGKWSTLIALICYLITSTDTIMWSQIWHEPLQNCTFVEPVINGAEMALDIFVVRIVAIACIRKGSNALGNCNRHCRSQSFYDNPKT